MAIKVKPNTPVTRNKVDGLKMLLFGKPNIGKTTFASSFPNAIVLNTDGNLGAFKTPSYDITNWLCDAKAKRLGIREEESFVNVVDALIAGDHDFDTIIVEIGYHIYNFMRSYVLDKTGIDHEADLGYGKGWTLVRTVWERQILKLFGSSYNVLFITHESMVEVENRGKKFTIPTTDLPAGQTKFISGLCQITARMTIEDKVIDGKKVKVRGLQLLPDNEFEIIGNKIGITVPFFELEKGYEYEDLVDLITDSKSSVKIK